MGAQGILLTSAVWPRRDVACEGCSQQSSKEQGPSAVSVCLLLPSLLLLAEWGTGISLKPA